MPSAQGHDDGPRLHGSTEDSLSDPSDAGHPSFLGWPVEGEVIRYTEETHEPSKTTTAESLSRKADLQGTTASESHASTKWGISLFTKLGIALGLSLAFWWAWKNKWIGEGWIGWVKKLVGGS
jgi:hypothetical protein